MGSSIISVLSSTEGAGSPANIGVVQTSFAGEPWEPQRPRLACSIRALGGPVFSGDKGEFGAAFTGGGGGAGGLHTAPMRGISQEALLGQGFGVISEIDVRSTFETKLGEENGQALGGYLIPGVCNPALAQRALTAEPDMGLLLPCKVVIRRGRDANATVIQTIDPQTMVRLTTPRPSPWSSLKPMTASGPR